MLTACLARVLHVTPDGLLREVEVQRNDFEAMEGMADPDRLDVFVRE